MFLAKLITVGACVCLLGGQGGAQVGAELPVDPLVQELQMCLCANMLTDGPNSNFIDSLVNVSSADPEYPAKYYRVSGPSGWRALTSTTHEYIRFNFVFPGKVTYIATMDRRNSKEYVKKYKVRYGNKSTDMKYYKDESGNPKIFEGNQVENTLKKNKLEPPIIASIIEIIPTEWHDAIAMRIELLGCAIDCAASESESPSSP